jgi:hypothetical protein
MHSSRTFLLAVLTLALGAASPARADSVCGPGRHVGAENDAVGASWQGCWPDNRPSFNSPGGTGGNGTAAALQRGAGVLSLIGNVGSLIDAWDSNTSIPSDPDAAERAAHGIASRDYNRRAIEAMQQKQFVKAQMLFGLAAKEAGDGDDPQGERINEDNVKYAAILADLAVAYLEEQKGDFQTASASLMNARVLAGAMSTQNIVDEISRLNDQLVAMANQAGQQVAPTPSAYSHCTYENMRPICN